MAGKENEKLADVKSRLRTAKRVVIFSGAGISAESGIPTFRGGGGLWGGHRVEDVATPQAFERNPKLVWDFYFERRQNAKQARPNPAHRVIAAWQNQIPFVGVVTQNVDGLHKTAGSREIRELHGSLWQSRCALCRKIREDYELESQELRTCGGCKGLLRPHIVWFGEPLDPDVIRDAVRWMREADLLFVVGTSGVVEPAASFVREAKLSGVFTVEVNIERTVLTPIADVSLFGKSGEIFQRLQQP